MKNNWTNIGIGRIALAAVLVATIGGAFAQGNGNNQPSGQAGGTGTTNVVVTNTAAQPVPTKDQNNPAYQPFQWQGFVSVAAGSWYGTTTFQVPAGKRLVVEQISALVSITGGASGQIPRLDLNTAAPNPQVNTFVPLVFVGSQANLSVSFVAMQPLRAYADGSVLVEVARSQDINGGFSGTLSGSVSVIGHLVNIP